MYLFLDKFFLFFHGFVVLFIMSGWIWKKTRRVNLYVILLTAFSWFGLGIWYGMGYCPLTDWHFTVLKKLGETNLPDSYIKYVIGRLTGVDFGATFVNRAVTICFFISLIISLFLNYRDYRRVKKNSNDLS